MQPVIEQATHALQLRRFEGAKTLVSAALAETDLPAARLPLLEVLAQAQAGLQEHQAAARSWHEAYRHATAHDDKVRLFEQARQALREQHDYATLLRLAQDHLQHVHTPQEQAVCFLAAGEGLIHLQRYHEARQQYLEPALELTGLVPETRLHLWHYLGLSHLAEHRFTDAAAAFRQSADLALGQHFASAAAHLAAQRAQLHHLRNAARFYEGVIHLIYQRPHQAVQSLQELQRPLTAVGASNVALFLGLAYRALQQPEVATRALQSLARSATCPEALRGPAAVVRMGIANIQEAPGTVGEHLEAALEAGLEPRMAWEPSWQALFYRELALLCHRLGCRAAAIACYEEGLKVVVQRLGTGDEVPLSPTLHGADLLTVLARCPLETWSALAQGELLQCLQGLAWLNDQTQYRGLADRALSLALRLVTTPEQEVALWCQRGWLMITTATADVEAGSDAGPAHTDVLAGLQRVQTRCTDAALARVVQGIAALLQGDADHANEVFTAIPTVPEVPEFQAVCVAAWLWAHARQETLPQTLTQKAAGTPLPWPTSTVLALALETLLSWSTPGGALASSMPWLATLLAHQPGATLDALRLLCRPGYLPAPQHTVLMSALTRLVVHPEHTALTDQVAVLLGGPVLVERIETLLGEFNERLAAPPSMPPQVARHRKHRQRRGPAGADDLTAEAAHVLQLIGFLHSSPQAMLPPALERSLPEVICRWLLRYRQLGAHAPEVVGAMLGLLRQCPGAATVIPTLLEQVALSRRQRQALEAALHSPHEATATALHWDDLQFWPIGRLLATLADLHRPAGAAFDASLVTPGWYIVALVLARVGLLPQAVACLQACLQQQPADPRTHYTLAQFLSAQSRHEAALQHTLQAWQHLTAVASAPQLLHLEILHQLLMLLETTAQYDSFPQWLEAFAHACAAVQQTALSPAQQQRVRAIQGSCALLRASYLAAVPASGDGDLAQTFAQQLACLEQAVTLSPLPTRHVALHRQAESLTRLHRYAAAEAIYHDIVQQWPDDQRAHQRLAVLSALQHPASEPADTDRLLEEALTAAFTGVSAPPSPSPLTPHSALTWLREAPRHTPGLLDVIDILTAYGGAALQRQAWQRALEILTPLYAMHAQPRQAYYLAVAYYASSQQAASGASALHHSEAALRYVQAALAGAPAMDEAVRLLPELEAYHQRLLTTRRQEQVRAAYRQRVRAIFAQHGMRVQEHTVDRAPDTPWVVLHEVADLDETTGKLVTVVHLFFNAQAAGTTPSPDETEVALYAQHQRDKQRLVETYGIEALPWPHTAYEGRTDFATLFPERLGLNRDVLFIAFADLHALLRYTKILQYTFQCLLAPDGAGPSSPASVLAATARYFTLMPLLRQRLQTLAAATPSKVVQRQISSVWDSLTEEPAPEQFQHLPTFVDTYLYFRAIVDTMRAHLELPPAERPESRNEERQPQRPTRRKRRQVKERWREGDTAIGREGYYSDVS